MRYGPARVVYSGDKERAQAFLPKGLQLLRNAQERQRLGGLNVLRDYQVLDDDSYCYVILGGGMAAVHIVAGYAPSVGEVEVERNVIPDFVSGVIRNGYIESASRWEGDSRRVLSQFHPTLRCAETYSLWGKKVQVPSYGYQEFERLAVEPLQGFPELRNPATSGQAAERVYSQYTLLRPTMYSGAMRGLVQALMGFGRQRRLPPAKDGQSRGREISLYEKIRSGPAQTDVDGGTPPSSRSTSTYLTEVANEGLQVRYDWKFYRTHGLTRAADGRWWLVEISGSAGVIAMPLPLHDATLSSTFRELLEQRGDVDALHLIEQFGGFPTGEPFPKAGSLESWIRAGRVVRLAARADLAEFYRHSPYSSDMGWAFNLRGDEAHNTAWRFGDDDLQRGVHYAISLQIGAVRPVKETADSPLLKRLERMRDAGLFPDRIDAAIWKAARMSAKQRALAIGTDEAVFRYVDALALEPIAVGSARVSRVSEGFLWFSPAAKQDNGNIIRFPETVLGHLVSHSMQPASRLAEQPALCHTTMHVFFAGNDLKWVKFYWVRESSAPAQNTSDFEDCMYVGQWRAHDEVGTRRIPLMFYTNDFDHREELPAGTVDTHIESKDLGYSSVDVIDFGPPYANEGSVTRTKRFLRRTEVRRVSSPDLGSGVAVPFGDRESYYYAWRRGHAGTEREVQHEYRYLLDPHHYEHWRNRAPWSGGEWSSGVGWPPSEGEEPGTSYWIRLEQHPTGYGPVTQRTVCTPGVRHAHYNWLAGTAWHDGNSYSPYDCGDAADEGPWLSGGEHATSLAYSVPEPPLPVPVRELSPPGGEYEVWWISSSTLGQIRTHREEGLGFGLWATPSPTVDTNLTQYIEATYNCLGEATSARYGLNLNGGSRAVGVPQYPGMESRPLTYIGVIDGG